MTPVTGMRPANLNFDLVEQGELEVAFGGEAEGAEVTLVENYYA